MDVNCRAGHNPTGFCRAVILMFCFLLSLGPSSALAQSPGDEMVVRTERLNLRDGPGTEHKVLREMPEGTIVKIQGKRNDGWVWVAMADGPSGFTSLKYLRPLTLGTPSDVDEFYSELEARDGPPAGRGYLSEVNAHYAYYCGSQSGLGLALYRHDGSAPRIWRADDWCVNGVQAKDIDGDGVSEVVYRTSGGGTGSFGVREKIVHWPENVAEPSQGYEYGTLSVSTVSTEFDVVLETEIQREMRYGENCRPEQYCPEWPPEATCRAVTTCAMTEVKKVRMLGEAPNLSSNPEWNAFLREYYISEGYVIEGGGITETLDDVSLEELAAIDDGTRPTISPERQAEIDAWLE